MSLREFAPEIRLAIFELAMALPAGRQIPALVIALRPDPVLYKEVLVLFYAKSICYLTAENWKATGSIGDSCLASVQKLQISFQFDWIQGIDLNHHRIFSTQNNIREFRASSVSKDHFLEEFLTILTLWISKLCYTSRTLQKIILDLSPSRIKTKRGQDGLLLRESFILEISDHLQVQRRFESWSAQDDFPQLFKIIEEREREEGGEVEEDEVEREEDEEMEEEKALVVWETRTKLTWT
jgi:hypothetical protein